MPKRRWLTRDIVIAKAVTLADENGRFTDLSLTTLAKAFNVRPPSLYNHIANLDDLHHGMAIALLHEILRDLRSAALGEVGSAALHAMAHAYRAFVRRHPGSYPLIIRAPEPDETELVALSAELGQLMQLVMASIGLHDSEAIHAIRGFRATVHGFATLETADGFKMPLDIDDSFQRLVAAFINGIAPTTGTMP